MHSDGQFLQARSQFYTASPVLLNGAGDLADAGKVWVSMPLSRNVYHANLHNLPSIHQTLYKHTSDAII